MPIVIHHGGALAAALGGINEGVDQGAKLAYMKKHYDLEMQKLEAEKPLLAAHADYFKQHGEYLKSETERQGRLDTQKQQELGAEQQANAQLARGIQPPQGPPSPPLEMPQNPEIGPPQLPPKIEPVDVESLPEVQQHRAEAADTISKLSPQSGLIHQARVNDEIDKYGTQLNLHRFADSIHIAAQDPTLAADPSAAQDLQQLSLGVAGGLIRPEHAMDLLQKRMQQAGQVHAERVDRASNSTAWSAQLDQRSQALDAAAAQGLLDPMAYRNAKMQINAARSSVSQYANGSSSLEDATKDVHQTLFSPMSRTGEHPTNQPELSAGNKAVHAHAMAVKDKGGESAWGRLKPEEQKAAYQDALDRINGGAKKTAEAPSAPAGPSDSDIENALVNGAASGQMPKGIPADRVTPQMRANVERKLQALREAQQQKSQANENARKNNLEHVGPNF